MLKTGSWLDDDCSEINYSVQGSGMRGGGKMGSQREEGGAVKQAKKEMMLVKFRGQNLKCTQCAALPNHPRARGQIKLPPVDKLKLEQFENKIYRRYTHSSTIYGKNTQPELSKNTAKYTLSKYKHSPGKVLRKLREFTDVKIYCKLYSGMQM